MAQTKLFSIPSVDCLLIISVDTPKSGQRPLGKGEVRRAACGLLHCGWVRGEGGFTVGGGETGSTSPSTPGNQWLQEALKSTRVGTSLAVQWLGLGACTSWGPGSMPGWVTKMPQATRHGQKQKRPHQGGHSHEQMERPRSYGCAEVCQSGRSHTLERHGSPKPPLPIPVARMLGTHRILSLPGLAVVKTERKAQVECSFYSRR